VGKRRVSGEARKAIGKDGLDGVSGKTQEELSGEQVVKWSLTHCWQL
jgi:hypothetical protein